MEGRQTYPDLPCLPRAVDIVNARVEYNRRCLDGAREGDLELQTMNGLGAKGTITVPLDGAARGSGRTRAPARGAVAAPPPPSSASHGAGTAAYVPSVKESWRRRGKRERKKWKEEREPPSPAPVRRPPRRRPVDGGRHSASMH
jgi:hypothetical protein